MMVYLYADSFLANMIIMTCLISALQNYKFSLKQMSKCLDIPHFLSPPPLS